jgi:hypothetical protein
VPSPSPRPSSKSCGSRRKATSWSSTTDAQVDKI